MQLIESIMWIIVFGIELAIMRIMLSDFECILAITLTFMLIVIDELKQKTITTKREEKQDDARTNRESK